jgi:hypothetical protein
MKIALLELISVVRNSLSIKRYSTIDLFAYTTYLLSKWWLIGLSTNSMSDSSGMFTTDARLVCSDDFDTLILSLEVLLVCKIKRSL